MSILQCLLRNCTDLYSRYKTKLHTCMYTQEVSEFKKYLHGLCDAGTKLLLSLDQACMV